MKISKLSTMLLAISLCISLTGCTSYLFENEGTEEPAVIERFSKEAEYIGENENLHNWEFRVEGVIMRFQVSLDLQPQVKKLKPGQKVQIDYAGPPNGDNEYHLEAVKFE
ncbi:hypothetical protein CN378_12990 [Bacillus sp. AFS015802]|uniref:hypothetical protein n=1 Tax=Bacillus sp. AFS015802 TaxID=2033486 RepID=UPI000BF9A9CE|nr:hypothetical protein [Bacillus sp. AFS015802]PFA66808.1 hypothetical protein CN378_12990 [Bacillus sp. AFS015802]